MDVFLEIAIIAIKPAYYVWKLAWYIVDRYGPDFSEGAVAEFEED